MDRASERLNLSYVENGHSAYSINKPIQSTIMDFSFKKKKKQAIALTATPGADWIKVVTGLCFFTYY